MKKKATPKAPHKKDYKKRAEFLSSLTENLEKCSQLTLPFVLILAITSAPLSLASSFFSILLIMNVLVFIFTSLSWKDEFKQASAEIASTEKTYKKELDSLQNQINVLENEQKLIQRDIEKNTQIEIAVRNKFTTLKKMRLYDYQTLTTAIEHNNKQKTTNEELSNI